MGESFEEKNIRIHEQLKELMKSRRGQILLTAEVKHLFEETFPDSKDAQFVQPPDHCFNMTNKKACTCAQTEQAIFECIKRGEFKVRDYSIA